jgi:hypothetical protein
MDTAFIQFARRKTNPALGIAAEMTATQRQDGTATCIEEGT